MGTEFFSSYIQDGHVHGTSTMAECLSWNALLGKITIIYMRVHNASPSVPMSHSSVDFNRWRNLLDNTAQ
jgi:hypothetical protein